MKPITHSPPNYLITEPVLIVCIQHCSRLSRFFRILLEFPYVVFNSLATFYSFRVTTMSSDAVRSPVSVA